MLILEDELEIVKLVNKDSSYESVTVCFIIAKSTVLNVWKVHKHVKQFVSKLSECI